LRAGTIDNEVAKEGMRFGAATSDDSSRGSGHPTGGPVGTRAHMHWFGITVASFERGDCRMSPNGIYVYGDDGRREIEVLGGRGVGTLEIQELYECLAHGKPIVHDGRWGMATMEVGEAIMQSAAERREIMLTHQVPAPE
jgi:predicted dehydrogenase